MLRKKVQVVVFDLSGKFPKVLLLKTNKARGSFWQNVTGSLNPKETPLKGAKRELFEETGIKPDKLLDLNYSFKYKDFLEHVFVAILLKTPPKIKLDPKEHDDFKWERLSKITSEDFKYLSNFESFIVAQMRIKE